MIEFDSEAVVRQLSHISIPGFNAQTGHSGHEGLVDGVVRYLTAANRLLQVTGGIYITSGSSCIKDRLETLTLLLTTELPVTDLLGKNDAGAVVSPLFYFSCMLAGGGGTSLTGD